MSTKREYNIIIMLTCNQPTTPAGRVDNQACSTSWESEARAGSTLYTRPTSNDW